MATELQRLISSLTLIQAHSPKASIELMGEEMGIFDANIHTMTPDQRKEILDLRYFFIVDCDGSKKYFWNSTEQREDGDYISYDENLEVK